MERRPNIQAGEVMKRTQDVFNRTGIEIPLAIKVLIVAAVSGILASILDELFNLPTSSLVFAFAWFVIALNGPTYAYLKGKNDLSGLIMAGVVGLVTAFFWFLTTEIIGPDPNKIDFNDINNHTILLVGWFEDMNILKAMVSGVLVGLASYGWFALLRRLPNLPLG